MRYPKSLKEIYAHPQILYVLGNPNLLHQPQIAMVGSRRPSEWGLKNAFRFGEALSNAGLCITSGMAAGIDAAAHQGALRGQAKTCAVLGSGVNVIYPKSNEALYRSIVQSGVVISEFPCGVEPKPYFFPRRNRIVTGLSLGVLVVEAALKSGSLISARLANEQGREIFAIPGNIHNPLARGCHQLLREGAKLVENVADVVEEIQFTATPST